LTQLLGIFKLKAMPANKGKEESLHKLPGRLKTLFTKPSLHKTLSTKQVLISLIPIIFLVFTLLITLIEVTRQEREFDIRRKAAEEKPLTQAPKEPDFIPGEIIIKFKPNTVNLKLNSQATSQGINLNQ
jgi:hypothetical protein